MKKIFRKNQIIITALALMIAVAGYVSYTKANPDKSLLETSADTVADTYEISDEDIVAGVFTDTEDNTPEAADTAGAEKKDEDKQAAAENGTENGAGDTTENGAEKTGDGAQKTGDAQAAEEKTGADAAQESAAGNPGETVLTSADVQTVDFAAEVKLNREQVRSKNKETLLEVINNASITEAQKQDAIDTMIAMTDVAERENAAEILLEAKGFTDVVVSITDESADVVLNMGDVTDAKRAQVEDIMKRKTGIAAENIVITPISQNGASKK